MAKISLGWYKKLQRITCKACKTAACMAKVSNVVIYSFELIHLFDDFIVLIR